MIADSLSAPAQSTFAITPTDSVVFGSGRIARAIWVGGAGNVALTGANDALGSAGTVIANVGAGTLLPISCKAVWNTNTTATNIVGLY